MPDHAPGMSVEEALARILELTGEPLPPEEVALVDGLGRVLAEPVVAAFDAPPWDNSAMDGYAVRASDTGGASSETPATLRVVGESSAGHGTATVVEPGTAIRIATGAPLPAGADAVVPVELTAPDTKGAASDSVRRFRPGEPPPDEVGVLAAVQPGASVRRRAEDIRTGRTVIDTGAELRPAHVALAAAAGRATLRVHRQPVVAVLSTGDELREPGTPLGADGIPDANRPGLLALCRQADVRTVDLGIAGDTLEPVVEALRRGLDVADAIVVTGGVSVGPYDILRLAFDAIGSVELWRVAVQPGRPFAFGRSRPRASDGRPVLLFGLPGNPVSAFVTFELFVLPALRRLAGVWLPPEAIDRGVLLGKVRKSPGRRAYLRVCAERDSGGRLARDASGRVRIREAGAQGSHVLSALAAADALAVVPETIDELEAGSEVEIRWLHR